MYDRYPIKVKVIFRTNYRTLNNLLKEKLHANGESLNGQSEVVLYNRDDENLLFEAKMTNLILVNREHSDVLEKDKEFFSKCTYEDDNELNCI